MSDSIIAILRVTYHPSGREEHVLGYVHYEFDATTAIAKLKADKPGEYVYRTIPCLSNIPGHC